MKTIARLAALARELEQQTTLCRRCGICQSVCPLFPHTRMEKDIARGKIAVLEGVMTEVVKNARAVLAQLDHCLLCGRCAAVCPNSVDTPAIFIRARLLLTEYLGLSPVKKLFFRQVLARPRRFDSLIRAVGTVRPLLFKSGAPPPAAGRPRAMTAMLLGDRPVPGLAPLPFHRLYQAPWTEPPQPDGESVLFFTGCLIDRVFPRVGLAAMKALHYHGFQATLLEDEGCCGIPALASGDGKTFERLLVHNMSRLVDKQFDRLVTACATCAFTIKKLWPMLTSPDNPHYDRILRLAEKTVDITELIASRLPADPPLKNEAPTPVTYHDPCHLRTSLKIIDPPRQLIAAAPGYTLTEMAGADTCCGMGGGFGLAHQKMSGKISRVKQEQIIRTGCRVVATACPACMIQLAGMKTGTREGELIVRHPIELYMQDR